MDDFMDNVYGPLSKHYCIYFYYLSIFGFVLLFLTLISTLFIGISKNKGFSFYLIGFTMALAYGILYFRNRLLHTMCSKSL